MAASVPRPWVKVQRERGAEAGLASSVTEKYSRPHVLVTRWPEPVTERIAMGAVALPGGLADPARRGSPLERVGPLLGRRKGRGGRLCCYY